VLVEGAEVGDGKGTQQENCDLAVDFVRAVPSPTRIVPSSQPQAVKING